MRRLVGRSVTIVLGICIAVSGLAGHVALSPPVEAQPDDPAAWQKLWHPAFRPALGSRIEMHGAQWLGDRFAVVGGDDRGAVVWWSRDGLEWTRTSPSLATRHGVGTSIDGDASGYVMIGHQWTPRPRGRIWYSDDGRRWREPVTELKRLADVHSVVQRDDGSFVVYGSGARGGCWMAISADAGATWDADLAGEWDRGAGGGCSGSVERDEDGLVGLTAMIGGGIGVSTDGAGWEQVVSAREIATMLADAPGRTHRTDLVPLGEGRFLVGGYDSTSLLWSRDDGLGLAVGLMDWTDLKGLTVAIGPERVIAVKNPMPAPLLSPPADVYTERWEQRQPMCRSRNPRFGDIAAMRPHERLECFGGRELTFKAWIPHSEYGGICPFDAPHDWMVCDDYWLASGPGPSPAYLNVAFAPNAKGRGALSWGDLVRVTGHFDDPAATLCPEPGWNGRMPDGWEPRTRAGFVNECRKRFIVTEIRRIED